MHSRQANEAGRGLIIVTRPGLKKRCKEAVLSYA